MLTGLSARVEHQRLVGDELPARAGALFKQVSEEASRGKA
jgi:hypothetical protein